MYSGICWNLTARFNEIRFGSIPVPWNGLRFHQMSVGTMRIVLGFMKLACSLCCWHLDRFFWKLGSTVLPWIREIKITKYSENATQSPPIALEVSIYYNDNDSTSFCGDSSKCHRAHVTWQISCWYLLECGKDRWLYNVYWLLPEHPCWLPGSYV